MAKRYERYVSNDSIVILLMLFPKTNHACAFFPRFVFAGENARWSHGSISSSRSPSAWIKRSTSSESLVNVCAYPGAAGESPKPGRSGAIQRKRLRRSLIRPGYASPLTIRSLLMALAWPYTCCVRSRSIGELRVLTPCSGQMLQAEEGGQWDHIEVDQVQLREGQCGYRIPGGFHACAFHDQHHSVWLICAGIKFADDALLVEFPDGWN